MRKKLALLGKWWWRFKRENEAWVKIIKSIPGSDGGFEGEVAIAKGRVWGGIVKAGNEIVDA